MNGAESLKAQFLRRTGYKLDLENPRTYCEKVQWRKVHDRRLMLPDFADKIGVKFYLLKKIGADYLVPHYWYVFDKPTIDEIRKEMLMDCVIKASHGCAWMLFQGANGTYLSADEITRHTDYWLENIYGQDKLQWAESQITPGILVEKYMTYKGGQCPLVKIYCFDGKAKIGKCLKHEPHTVAQRAKPKSITWYNSAEQLLDITFGQAPPANEPAPIEYEECVALSEQLTQNIDHVRVDWLLTDEGIKFSEFSWYPTSGMDRITPFEYDRIMGDWWTLPKLNEEGKKL